jgi:hypothetical protein
MYIKSCKLNLHIQIQNLCKADQFLNSIQKNNLLPLVEIYLNTYYEMLVPKLRL